MKILYFMLFALFFSACSLISPSQTLPANKYFDITLEKNVLHKAKQKDFTIIVALPKGLAYTNEIFYKKNNIVNSYAYHFWKENPALMIKSFLEFHLQNLGLFKAVLNQDSIAKADYVLESKIDLLEQEFSNNTHSKIKFGINLNLIHIDTKKLITSQYFYYEKLLNDNNPQVLIQAYDEMFSLFASDMQYWIIKNLE
ncbi:ABC-type transport auxiliary lipoprotein family protein [Campylobacter sp. RM16704]|uniref:ABC-type transport auxiliary lipoprotein family protein n=1 Tax=Campylobacter sp. RM16704 TaxID=1500960 RepID=UPI00057FDB6B|nr:ABC-type transport auxiliary lipoprotein family protein [Campylobacter sp. RM16704]AJC85635.1 putative lipid asymmetry ABC transporter MlaABCDEF component MlaB [Campylobacter sp. RM16704]